MNNENLQTIQLACCVCGEICETDRLLLHARVVCADCLDGEWSNTLYEAGLREIQRHENAFGSGQLWSYVTEDIAGGACIRQEWGIAGNGVHCLINQTREVWNLPRFQFEFGSIDIPTGNRIYQVSGLDHEGNPVSEDIQLSETRETTIEEVEARIDAALAENAEPIADAGVIGAPTHRNIPESHFRELWEQANEE